MLWFAGASGCGCGSCRCGSCGCGSCGCGACRRELLPGCTAWKSRSGMLAGPAPGGGAFTAAGAFMGAGASAGPGALAAAGAFMGVGALAGAGKEPESAVPAPDESVPLVDNELDPLLRSGEVTATDAEDEVGAADMVAEAAAPLPLVQPASSTIKPLVRIRQPLWKLMLAPTRQQVSRCATVTLLESLHGWQVRYRCCGVLIASGSLSWRRLAGWSPNKSPWPLNRHATRCSGGDGSPRFG